MRDMIQYIKQNGVLPETHFPKGAIITYIAYDKVTGKEKEKNIIILDHIEEERQCDIFGSLALVIADKETPYIDYPEEGWSRVWHNGGKVRYASWVELSQLCRALAQTIEPGMVQDVELIDTRERESRACANCVGVL